MQVALQNAPQNTETISFIGTKTKKNSFTYRSMVGSARECAQALQRVAAVATSAPEITSNVQAPATSGFTSSNPIVNEILEYKKLANAGIITQEEFEAKKKQLLGL